MKLIATTAIAVLTSTGRISDIDLPRACETAGYRLPEE